MSSDRKFFFHPFYFLSNQTLQMKKDFNLKWVGKQLKNSYTTGRFLEEITKKKREDYFPLCTCMVMVTRGKDRGETGVVKHVIRSQNCLIVEGKNLTFGPKDTLMDLALEKTHDAKEGHP
ncbi:unnamed protein product [Camellia sinensis]